MTKLFFLFVRLCMSASLAATTMTTAFAPLSVRHGRRRPASSRVHYQEGTGENPKAAAAAAEAATPPPVTSIFPPWKTPQVTARGDYVEDLYLEMDGPLYSLQKDLPKLPLSEISETMERLLPTVLPLAQNEAERQAFLQAVQVFANQAQPFHARLVERQRQATQSSWLQSLWQSLVYLQYRDPLPHYVTYYLLVPDDDKLATDNDAGLHRAAAMLYVVAEARQGICSGQMAPDMAGASPLCSVGFKYLFHACRVPQPHSDVYHLYDPSRYRHAIVACGGQFYAVDIVDEHQNPLPLPLLEARLLRVRELAQQQQQQEWPQMGWATSLDRDAWTEMRQQLLTDNKDDAMAAALEQLESGAFLLALDDEEPETLTEACTEFWHGGQKSGGNRWFDKSMQLLVTKNGRVAYQGEHAMLDAAPTIAVIRKILKTTYGRLAKKFSGEAVPDKADVDVGVRNVFADCWSDDNFQEQTQKLVEKARQHHVDLSNEFDLETVRFEDFGKKQAKQWGYDGPLFAQLAIQLAAYRLFGEVVGCYEAASTRPFLHGRTETTRPISPATASFVQIMNDKEASVSDKVSALEEAASTIGEYQTLASSGKGVDRHLFGISSMVQEGEDAPELYSDPLFQRAKAFRLSTSSVVFTPGFGPVHEKGLGIGFNAEKDSFVYLVTSREENNYARPFCELIQQSLREMAELLEVAQAKDSN
eukprot:scaffold1267_cov171-Amphora_coffeaeformis.AAC.32